MATPHTIYVDRSDNGGANWLRIATYTIYQGGIWQDTLIDQIGGVGTKIYRFSIYHGLGDDSNGSVGRCGLAAMVMKR